MLLSEFHISGVGPEILTGKAALGLATAQTCRFIRGEWFLDSTAGVPYVQDFFVKNPNLNHCREDLRQELLHSPGILSVESLDLTLNTLTRRASVSFKANGTLNVTTEVTAFGGGSGSATPEEETLPEIPVTLRRNVLYVLDTNGGFIKLWDSSLGKWGWLYIHDGALILSDTEPDL
jgi:hypothetical protein